MPWDLSIVTWSGCELHSSISNITTICCVTYTCIYTGLSTLYCIAYIHNCARLFRWRPVEITSLLHVIILVIMRLAYWSACFPYDWTYYWLTARPRPPVHTTRLIDRRVYRDYRTMEENMPFCYWSIKYS